MVVATAGRVRGTAGSQRRLRNHDGQPGRQDHRLVPGEQLHATVCRSPAPPLLEFRRI